MKFVIYNTKSPIGDFLTYFNIIRISYDSVEYKIDEKIPVFCFQGDKRNIFLLNKDIHETLTSFDIEYRIIAEPLGGGHCKWSIDIPNNNQAMLFKLLWI